MGWRHTGRRRQLLRILPVALLLAACLQRGLTLATTRDTLARALAHRGLSPPTTVAWWGVTVGGLTLWSDATPERPQGVWVAGSPDGTPDGSHVGWSKATVTPSWTLPWWRPTAASIRLDGVEVTLQGPDDLRRGIAHLLVPLLSFPGAESAEVELRAARLVWRRPGTHPVTLTDLAGRLRRAGPPGRTDVNRTRRTWTGRFTGRDETGADVSLSGSIALDRAAGGIIVDADVTLRRGGDRRHWTASGPAGDVVWWSTLSD
ncbi:MAG: hypothetical protein ACE5IK_11445 [Acidobacteriota bacterium]